MPHHRLVTTTRSGIPVEVRTGWNAGSQGYFLSVRRTDLPADDSSGDADLFTTDQLPKTLALPQRYEPMLSILAGMGIALPKAVLEDIRFCADPLAMSS
jgi:hypothetical protein